MDRELNEFEKVVLAVVVFCALGTAFTVALVIFAPSGV